MSSDDTPTKSARNETLSELGLSEWSDVCYTPIEPSEVLRTDTPIAFRHVFPLIYAVLNSSERSLRALHLSARGIRLNPSNPTVWQLRRSTAIALSEIDPFVWPRELSFTSSIIQNSPKNYQAWEHRRLAATKGNLLLAERGFTDIVLANDPKNYHAWSHRAWLIRDHKLIDGELAVTEWFIRADVHNNSAWNHRWLVTAISGRQLESKLVLEMLRLAPNNQSAWNYALALHAVIDCSDFHAFAEAMADDAATVCIGALRFLVLTAARHDMRVAERCEALQKLDHVRQAYWGAQKAVALARSA